MPEKNAFGIFFQSVEGDKWYDDSVIDKKRFPKTSEVTVHHGGLIIEILSPSQHRVSGCVLFNHNMGPKIPNWLIPYLIKTMASVFNHMYAKQLKNMPKKYLELIDEKKEFYDAIRESIRKNERDKLLTENKS